jgi:post-segregation antitoxin (ccd killing protein)
MKIQELMEAIKGWKHAHGDIQKMRAARAAASHTAKLVRLKKDGSESHMHDAVSTYETAQDARKRHMDLVKLNPGRNITHNLYVDSKFVEVLTPDSLTEVSHKVGMAAIKALCKTAVTQEVQEKHMKQWQELDRKEDEIQARLDAHTGKYAKELMQISRQKIKVASAGGLNAFGKPLQEHASSGATSAASVATLAQPLGAVVRRPSLFGHTSGVPDRKKRKSEHK